MIVIRVEIWPQGDQGNAREIANAVIANDGSGTKSVGNYLATFQTAPGRLADSEVKGFKRRQNHVWELIRLSLNNAFEKEVSNGPQR